MAVNTSSVLLSLPPPLSENITRHNSEFSDLITQSSNLAISPSGSKDTRTEQLLVLPRKLVLTQSEYTSPPPDATTIVILLSELLPQSHQLKNSTELLESWHQRDSLSLIMKKEHSPTRLETRSILNSKLPEEKLPMPGAILTFPLDLLVPKKEKSMVPSKTSDTTHSQLLPMMLKDTLLTVTTPSIFNLQALLVHIFLFSI